MATLILLKNATLLLHDQDGHVVPTLGDLMIRNNIITYVEPNIEPHHDTRVIDCTNKIVSPGFINTHIHLWQTQLKGAYANETLVPYLARSLNSAALYTIQDAFWGQLAGSLETIDAGTTTVLDHSHLCPGPAEYPRALLQALTTSGLRAVYAYTGIRGIAERNPVKLHIDSTSKDALSNWQTLASSGPYGHGRVTIGYANDNVFAPAEELQHLYSTLRKDGVQVITTHGCNGPTFGKDTPSALQMLARNDLLGPDIIISHASTPRPGDDELCRQSGAFISSTPHTEMQMGDPPAALQPEFYANGSMGVDCHSWGSGFMPYQMRLLLQWERTSRVKKRTERGQWSREIAVPVENVFNLATVNGAKALRMDNQIGKIAVGMKADLVIFGTESPSMLAAAVEDPLAAVVLHSSERDVETVIIDGIVRKENGVLLDVDAQLWSEETHTLVRTGKKVTWKAVVENVLKSRLELKERMEKTDWSPVEKALATAMYCDMSAMV